MKRTQSILGILLLVDIACGGALWYGYTLIQDKKNEGRELASQVEQEIQKGTELIQLKRTLSVVQQDQKEMEKYIFDSSIESQIRLVTLVESLGTTTTGGLVDASSFELSTDQAPIMRASFSIKGTWGQVYYFLRLLEEFPANLTVAGFDAQGSQNNEWAGNVSILLPSLKQSK